MKYKKKQSPCPYRTKSAGTGGFVRGEEDFVVDEIPAKKFFAKFERSGSGVKSIKGPYTLALLRKKGMTTRDAVKFIAKKFCLKSGDIGYAGLKDAFAVTSQYITVKGNIGNIKGNPELTMLSRTRNMMQVGELEGNKFTITLRSCKNPENISALVNEIKARGMPNYFGPQRFGRYGDNHKIGRMILKGKYDFALRIINERNKAAKKSLREIDKGLLKFFLHSYQSFVFNSVLKAYCSRHTKPYFGVLPLVGSGTKFKNSFADKETKKILEKDRINPGDFSRRDLNITCTGSSRPAFVQIKDIEYDTKGNDIELCFFLPKGSYATVLLGEIAKSKSIFNTFWQR